MPADRPTFRAAPTAVFAAALCLLIVLFQNAGRAADHPATVPAAGATGVKLVIVSAVYGDVEGGKTADVTAKVSALVKDNSLSVDVNKATFGDPAANGKPKKLKVGYTVDGIYRTKTVDEGEILDISTRLFIRKAVYGDLPAGASMDVTEQVADLVRKNHLSVEAGNDQFGDDPAPNTPKKLRVDYTFDGASKSKTVSEGQSLTVSDKGE